MKNISLRNNAVRALAIAGAAIYGISVERPAYAQSVSSDYTLVYIFKVTQSECAGNFTVKYAAENTPSLTGTFSATDFLLHKKTKLKFEFDLLDADSKLVIGDDNKSIITGPLKDAPEFNKITDLTDLFKQMANGCANLWTEAVPQMQSEDTAQVDIAINLAIENKNCSGKFDIQIDKTPYIIIEGNVKEKNAEISMQVGNQPSKITKLQNEQAESAVEGCRVLIDFGEFYMTEYRPKLIQLKNGGNDKKPQP